MMARKYMRSSDALALGVFGCLLAFPFFGGDFYIQLITKIMILSIFAMSLNLLVGFTGLVSLGHATFYGLGAYALVFSSPQYDPANLWLTLPFSMLAASAAALIIGTFVLRTNGVYFIMVTLAFAQMVYYIFHDGKFSGGSDGVYIYAKPEMRLFGLDLLDLEKTFNFYLLALFAMAFCYGALRVMLHSLFGRTLLGIRTNERRMLSLGYATFRYKLVSFVIAGAFAGLSGYLSAAQFGFVNPSFLGWHQSAQALIMVILGGMGTLSGPILGTFALVLLQEFLSELTQRWLLLMGGVIILAVIKLPHGLAGGLTTLFSARKCTLRAWPRIQSVFSVLDFRHHAARLKFIGRILSQTLRKTAASMRKRTSAK
ncbi:branched-chain amino acid ABC transporter permease [Pseudorhodoplanes sinuspersici]|nr:branched-chain amino acid ABC transporter permease [Pseudorhodoplanes sinuspersici]RKE68029.1 amino acid/amide ABC transporter membrane protein 2 (HAAT family) [Pseudorhodoplanes sinuspersici]